MSRNPWDLHTSARDLLRCAREHPRAEVVGICNAQREKMQPTIDALGIPEDRVFSDHVACLEETKPDMVAVNQNGRWAPYFSYLRQAVKQGLLGELVSVDMHVAWDHTWIKDTAFEEIHHIVLYDFAIHWFDIVTCVFGDRKPTEVFARAVRVAGQALAPPLGAQAVVGYKGGTASLVFQANTKLDPADHADDGGWPGGHLTGGSLVRRRIRRGDGGTALRDRGRPGAGEFRPCQSREPRIVFRGRREC